MVEVWLLTDRNSLYISDFARYTDVVDYDHNLIT